MKKVFQKTIHRTADSADATAARAVMHVLESSRSPFLLRKTKNYSRVTEVEGGNEVLSSSASTADRRTAAEVGPCEVAKEKRRKAENVNKKDSAAAKTIAQLPVKQATQLTVRISYS